MRRMYDWVSIPELGNRLQLDKACATLLLEELGLRWKSNGNIQFRSDVFTGGIARIITPKHGYEVVEWNFFAIKAIINDIYPAEGWAYAAEHEAIMSYAKRMPF